MYNESVRANQSWTASESRERKREGVEAWSSSCHNGVRSSLDEGGCVDRASSVNS